MFEASRDCLDIPLCNLRASPVVSSGLDLIFLLAQWPQGSRAAYKAAGGVKSEYFQRLSRSCINFYDLHSGVT